MGFYAVQSKLIGHFAVLVQVALILVLAVTSPHSVAITLTGVMVVVIAGLPAIEYAYRYRDATAPFFPAVGLFYLAFFGLPIFTVPLYADRNGLPVIYGIRLIEEITVQPLLVVLAGVTAMVAGFYAIRSLRGKRLPIFRPSREGPDDAVKWLFWILVVAQVLYRLVPQLRAIPSIGQFIEPAGLIGFGGLLIYLFRSTLNTYEKIFLLAAVFPVEIYLRLRFLFLSDILLFLIFFALLLTREKKWKLITGLMVIIIFAFSLYGVTTAIRGPNTVGFKNLALAAKAYLVFVIQGDNTMEVEGKNAIFRSSDASDEGINASTGEEVATVIAKRRKKVSAFEEAISEGREITVGTRFRSLAQRMGHIWVFHRVYDWTPSKVPYWNGETYAPLLTSSIPRIIFPSKPEERAGGLFGARYELLPPSSAGTSVNIPWITELQANFGAPFTIVGMAIIGVLLGMADRIFNAREMTGVDSVIALGVIFPLVYPESNVSVIIGSLPLFILAIYLYFFLGLKAIRMCRPSGRE